MPLALPSEAPPPKKNKPVIVLRNSYNGAHKQGIGDEDGIKELRNDNHVQFSLD